MTDLTNLPARTADLVALLAARAGDDDLERAHRALIATLEVLSAALPSADARALALDLPPGLAPDEAPAPDAADPFAALADREGVAPGVALEYAHLVCQVVAETVSPETRTRLHLHLPDPWRDVFHQRRAAPPAPPRATDVPGTGHTLAAGRPGSRHPLADAAPHPAHSESVARTDTPHADSKLSSGGPGGEPLSEAHPDRRR